jgi:tRNA(fMet)-specific endonuclease VapC
MYFLDTNTCIYFLNGRYTSIKERLLAIPPNQIAIPSVVKAELLLGAMKSSHGEKTMERVEEFLAPFEIYAFDGFCAKTYAEIRAGLEKAGEVIGPNDMIIASIVIFHEGLLVTNNVREFQRIKGLKMENWVMEE